MRHSNGRYTDNERLDTLVEEEQQYERMKSIKSMRADVDDTEDYLNQEDQPVIKRKGQRTSNFPSKKKKLRLGVTMYV